MNCSLCVVCWTAQVTSKKIGDQQKARTSERQRRFDSERLDEKDGPN